MTFIKHIGCTCVILHYMEDDVERKMLLITGYNALCLYVVY